MRWTSEAWLGELLVAHRPPCVSIYMPVERAKPPAAANPRLYRDQIERAEQLLAARSARA